MTKQGKEESETAVLCTKSISSSSMSDRHYSPSWSASHVTFGWAVRHKPSNVKQNLNHSNNHGVGEGEDSTGTEDNRNTNFYPNVERDSESDGGESSRSPSQYGSRRQTSTDAHHSTRPPVVDYGVPEESQFIEHMFDFTGMVDPDEEIAPSIQVSTQEMSNQASSSNLDANGIIARGAVNVENSHAEGNSSSQDINPATERHSTGQTPEITYSSTSAPEHSHAVATGSSDYVDIGQFNDISKGIVSSSSSVLRCPEPLQHQVSIVHEERENNLDELMPKSCAVSSSHILTPQSLSTEHSTQESYSFLVKSPSADPESLEGLLPTLTSGKANGSQNEQTSTSREDKQNTTTKKNEDEPQMSASKDFETVVPSNSTDVIISQSERTDRDADQLLDTVISGKTEKSLGPNVTQYTRYPREDISLHEDADSSTLCALELSTADEVDSSLDSEHNISFTGHTSNSEKVVDCESQSSKCNLNTQGNNVLDHSFQTCAVQSQTICTSVKPEQTLNQQTELNNSTRSKNVFMETRRTCHDYEIAIDNVLMDNSNDFISSQIDCVLNNAVVEVIHTPHSEFTHCNPCFDTQVSLKDDSKHFYKKHENVDFCEGYLRNDNTIDDLVRPPMTAKTGNRPGLGVEKEMTGDDEQPRAIKSNSTCTDPCNNNIPVISMKGHECSAVIRGWVSRENITGKNYLSVKLGPSMIIPSEQDNQYCTDTELFAKSSYVAVDKCYSNTTLLSQRKDLNEHIDPMQRLDISTAFSEDDKYVGDVFGSENGNHTNQQRHDEESSTSESHDTTAALSRQTSIQCQENNPNVLGYSTLDEVPYNVYITNATFATQAYGNSEITTDRNEKDISLHTHKHGGHPNTLNAPLNFTLESNSCCSVDLNRPLPHETPTANLVNTLYAKEVHSYTQETVGKPRNTSWEPGGVESPKDIIRLSENTALFQNQNVIDNDKCRGIAPKQDDNIKTEIEIDYEYATETNLHEEELSIDQEDVISKESSYKTSNISHNDSGCSGQNGKVFVGGLPEFGCPEALGDAYDHVKLRINILGTIVETENTSILNVSSMENEGKQLLSVANSHANKTLEEYTIEPTFNMSVTQPNQVSTVGPIGSGDRACHEQQFKAKMTSPSDSEAIVMQNVYGLNSQTRTAEEIMQHSQDGGQLSTMYPDGLELSKIRVNQSKDCNLNSTLELHKGRGISQSSNDKHFNTKTKPNIEMLLLDIFSKKTDAEVNSLAKDIEKDSTMKVDWPLSEKGSEEDNRTNFECFGNVGCSFLEKSKEEFHKTNDYCSLSDNANEEDHKTNVDCSLAEKPKEEDSKTNDVRSLLEKSNEKVHKTNECSFSKASDAEDHKTNEGCSLSDLSQSEDHKTNVELFLSENCNADRHTMNIDCPLLENYNLEDYKANVDCSLSAKYNAEDYTMNVYCCPSGKSYVLDHTVNIDCYSSIESTANNTKMGPACYSFENVNDEGYTMASDYNQIEKHNEDEKTTEVKSFVSEKTKEDNNSMKAGCYLSGNANEDNQIKQSVCFHSENATAKHHTLNNNYVLSEKASAVENTMNVDCNFLQEEHANDRLKDSDCYQNEKVLAVDSTISDDCSLSEMTNSIDHKVTVNCCLSHKPNEEEERQVLSNNREQGSMPSVALLNTHCISGDRNDLFYELGKKQKFEETYHRDTLTNEHETMLGETWSDLTISEHDRRSQSPSSPANSYEDTCWDQIGQEVSRETIKFIHSSNADTLRKPLSPLKGHLPKCRPEMPGAMTLEIKKVLPRVKDRRKKSAQPMSYDKGTPDDHLRQSPLCVSDTEFKDSNIYCMEEYKRKSHFEMKTFLLASTEDRSPHPTSRQQSPHPRDGKSGFEETCQGAGSGEPNAHKFNKESKKLLHENKISKDKDTVSTFTKKASNNNPGSRQVQGDSPLLRIASCESLCTPRSPEMGEPFQCEINNKAKFHRDRKGFRRQSCERAREVECLQFSTRVTGDCSRKYSRRENSNEGNVCGRARKCGGSRLTPLTRATLEPLKVYVPMQPKSLKSMNVAEFDRYQANKKLRENIAKIQRSKAKVDCHMDPKLMDNSYRVRETSRLRLEEHSKLVRENLKFSESLQGPKSDYDRECHLKDFKKNYVAMVKLGRHTETWEPPKGVRAITVKSKLEPCYELSSTSVDMSEDQGSSSMRQKYPYK